MPEPYIVADQRVIAVIAEPPEAEAGASVEIRAVVADPRGEAPSVRFGHCADRTATECEDEVFAEVQATMIGPGLFEARTRVTLGNGPFDVTHVHVPNVDAFKRVVVGSGANKNPAIDEIFMVTDDGEKHTSLVAGTQYIAVPAFDSVHLQLFVIEQYDGTLLPAQEQGIFSWSCSVACTFDTALSYDFTSVRVTPGETDVPFVVYLVMRDGRGGEAFKAFF